MSAKDFCRSSLWKSCWLPWRCMFHIVNWKWQSLWTSLAAEALRFSVIRIFDMMGMDFCSDFYRHGFGNSQIYSFSISVAYDCDLASLTWLVITDLTLYSSFQRKTCPVICMIIAVTPPESLLLFLHLNVIVLTLNWNLNQRLLTLHECWCRWMGVQVVSRNFCWHWWCCCLAC